MSVDERGSAKGVAPAETGASVDVGPLGILPKLAGRQVRLDQRLGLLGPDLGSVVAGCNQLLGGGMSVDRFSVQWRASGLQRPGVVAQFAWPRLRTRVALGIDPTLAHALVDRLLGFERRPAEARLQVSPVEWGVLAFLVASGAEQLEQTPGPLGPWDLTIDRVGPDAFDLAGLGSIITWRWRVRVGQTTGAARLWLPESLLIPWLDQPLNQRDLPSGPSSPVRSEPAADWSRFDDLASEWRAEAGRITIASGSLTGQLQTGRLLLIDDRPISGTVLSPEGEVALVQLARSNRLTFRARVQPGSSGDRLVMTSRLEQQPTFREPLMANLADHPTNHDDPSSNRSEPAAASVASPLESADVSVTLTVELGRVSFPLRRLAELRPGDVVELNRHAREPVDLSSNGRLVARGELVQVDTELGVRITQVFF